MENTILALMVLMHMYKRIGSRMVGDRIESRPG